MRLPMLWSRTNPVIIHAVGWVFFFSSVSGRTLSSRLKSLSILSRTEPPFRLSSERGEGDDVRRKQTPAALRRLLVRASWLAGGWWVTSVPSVRIGSQRHEIL